MLNDSSSLYESIRSNLGIWREKIETKKSFREEWQEFISGSRRLIQKTIDVEENFVSSLSRDFGDSLQTAESYQKSLDELMPTVKV